MPEWMKAYQVAFKPNRKEAFLIKNQRGLRFLVQRFQLKEKRRPNPLGTIHPTLRLLTLCFLLLLISLTRQAILLWLVGLYLGSLLLLVDAASLRNIIKKALLLLVMPLAVYLPALFFKQSSSLFLMRLPLIALTVSQYTETTSIYELLTTLKRLHLSNVVLLQLDITVKYIYLFGHLLLKMLTAVEARAVGGTIRFRLGSNLISIIYLKAVTYGRQLNWALEARCFTGEYYRVKVPLKKQDYWFVAAHSLLFMGLIFFRRL